MLFGIFLGRFCHNSIPNCGEAARELLSASVTDAGNVIARTLGVGQLAAALALPGTLGGLLAATPGKGGPHLGDATVIRGVFFEHLALGRGAALESSPPFGFDVYLNLRFSLTRSGCCRHNEVKCISSHSGYATGNKAIAK